MMRLVTDDFEADVIDAPYEPADDGFPGEAEMILSAMNAAAPAVDRRGNGRREHRAVADLRLHARSHEPAVPLYTRDVSAGGVGFITQQRLPLGYRGVVTIALEDGSLLDVPCSVYRCRESINGWYEGALHFTHRRPELA